MNLTKLFEMQKVLDQDIERNHPIVEGEDRLSKKILALLVELGECANEWRGFKFWSNDQEPETLEWVECSSCDGKGVRLDWGAMQFWECEECKGTGDHLQKCNDLLEEYVDCLHFILSIGNDIGIELESKWSWVKMDYDMTKWFSLVFQNVVELNEYESMAESRWKDLFENFYWLGESLGFTWEQIEQAYYDKNKINFERQENGY